MKFQNQARLCLAIYGFRAHSMLSLCLTFQGTGLLVWEKLCGCEGWISFYWFI